MMKRWLYVGLTALCIWLLISGHLELFLLSFLGLGGAGSAKLVSNYAEKKKAVDVALEETKKMIENAQDLLEKHQEEVANYETEDFSGVPISEFIESANARERARGYHSTKP